MMTSTCSSGHTSDADDFCDVCGTPIAVVTGGPAGLPPPPQHVPTQAPPETADEMAGNLAGPGPTGNGTGR
ncbi:MAG: hypothetical protein ACLGIF_01105 [Actinomycetes bacterium]